LAEPPDGGNLLLLISESCCWFRHSGAPMDDLTAQIEAMFHRYAADLCEGRADGVRLAKKFRKDMDSLIAKHGRPAIDAALDALPVGEKWPSAAMH